MKAIFMLLLGEKAESGIWSFGDVLLGHQATKTFSIMFDCSGTTFVLYVSSFYCSEMADELEVFIILF